MKNYFEHHSEQSHKQIQEALSTFIMYLHVYIAVLIYWLSTEFSWEKPDRKIEMCGLTI